MPLHSACGVTTSVYNINSGGLFNLPGVCPSRIATVGNLRLYRFIRLLLGTICTLSFYSDPCLSLRVSDWTSHLYLLLRARSDAQTFLSFRVDRL